MKWYSLKEISRSASNEIVAEVEAGSDSPWFSGHFPGDPILPGVAQLEMVFDAIQESSDKTLKKFAVRKVRFKQIIRPNDPIRIVVRPQGGSPATFSFRVMVKGQVACSGVMVTGESGQ